MGGGLNEATVEAKPRSATITFAPFCMGMYEEMLNGGAKFSSVVICKAMNQRSNDRTQDKRPIEAYHETQHPSPLRLSFLCASLSKHNVFFAKKKGK